MIRHKGATGIMFMSIVIAFAMTLSYFSYRYYGVYTSRTVREMTYKEGIIALRNAMDAYKEAAFRRYSSRSGDPNDGHYYAFFPEDLTHLVTEGFLNLDDSGLKMVVVDGRNMLVDKNNRPIVYLRSKLARVPFGKDRKACQFDYFKTGSTVDVRVPSVLVVFPGGRVFDLRDKNNEGQEVDVRYSALYNQHAGNTQPYLRFNNNHYTAYESLVNSGNIGYSVQNIRKNATGTFQRIAEMDEIIVFDAVNEYVALEREVSSNMASLANNFVSQWRLTYVEKLAEAARIARIPPDQYLILASTRTQSGRGEWPTEQSGRGEWPTDMLKSLCFETNNEVFGEASDTIVFGYNTENDKNGPRTTHTLEKFSKDGTLKTKLKSGPSTDFLKSFSFDERFLTEQRISSLSKGYLPGISLELTCKCRLQNEQAVDCRELGFQKTMYDDRDLFIREMFLEVSRIYEKSECPLWNP